jgi:hypothetical protein
VLSVTDFDTGSIESRNVCVSDMREAASVLRSLREDNARVDRVLARADYVLHGLKLHSDGEKVARENLIADIAAVLVLSRALPGSCDDPVDECWDGAMMPVQSMMSKPARYRENVNDRKHVTTEEFVMSHPARCRDNVTTSAVIPRVAGKM